MRERGEPSLTHRASIEQHGCITDVQTTVFMAQASEKPAAGKQRFDLKIPPVVPGSEASPIPQLDKNPAIREKQINSLYPELPPLPTEPKPLPGPNNQPYTLASLQQIAAGNSPQLRQAAADVEAAKGNLIQARAYPNPTVSFQAQPSNDGSTAGVQGFGVDQKLSNGGKLKLQAAAAEKDLDNAELALKRARSDLATGVRNAYFNYLVAQETMRIDRSLARFTDEIYRLQVDLIKGGQAAPHEPAALRAQAFTTRLAYKQAIQNYTYAWKQLVAAIGLHQLPLSEVAGRLDTAIPYFDFDAVRLHALQNHTDMLTARNVIDKARYNLKLAQVTPWYPDADVNFAVLKEFALPPKQMVWTASVGVPLPIWDKNKGNIIAAQAALLRASEEPHRVELALNTNLATAYANYKNNLDALEYYRRNILPNQVRYYRGVYQRRQVDINAAFGDLVTAQQTLVTNVTTYLTTLGQLWTSVVSVADVLQTDDLFQLGQPLPVPELPDLEQLPGWMCEHPCGQENMTR